MESHRLYLEDNKTTRLYHLIESYTGANSDWLQYQELLRKYNVTSYSCAVSRYGDEHIFDLRDSLNQFILEAPIVPTETILFRGTDFQHPEFTPGIIVDWGFSGASLNKSKALEFGKILYEIIFPAESPILFINAISRVADEWEALIPAGSEFTVIDQRMEDATMVIRVSFNRIRNTDDNPLYAAPVIDNEVQIKWFGKFKIILNSLMKAGSSETIRAKMNLTFYDTIECRIVGREVINGVLREATVNWCKKYSDVYSKQYLANIDRFLF